MEAIGSHECCAAVELKGLDSIDIDDNTIDEMPFNEWIETELYDVGHHGKSDLRTKNTYHWISGGGQEKQGDWLAEKFEGQGYKIEKIGLGPHVKGSSKQGLFFYVAVIDRTWRKKVAPAIVRRKETRGITVGEVRKAGGSKARNW